MCSGFNIRKYGVMAKRLLYGEMGQSVRLEWREYVGGTYDPVFDFTDGATGTTEVLDTRAIIQPLTMNSLKMIQDHRFEVGDAMVLLDPDVNLNNREKLVIAQMHSAESVSGSGSCSGSVISVPDAEYTPNAFNGHWVLFDSCRFQIVSHSADSITVRLDGCTLPESGSFRIMPVTEWFPVIDNPDLGDVAMAFMGNRIALQSVFCKRHPIAGGGNEND